MRLLLCLTRVKHLGNRKKNKTSLHLFRDKPDTINSGLWNPEASKDDSEEDGAQAARKTMHRGRSHGFRPRDSRA